MQPRESSNINNLNNRSKRNEMCLIYSNQYYDFFEHRNFFEHLKYQMDFVKRMKFLTLFMENQSYSMK
jgi:hypothetical protein